MKRTTIITGASAVAAAAALVGTGAALSSAATGPATPSPSATSSPADRPAPHEHTPVTGDELAKVTAAVTAKDSAVTVTTVRKDPDGSYDVDGTKAGAPVRLEVSKDLKSITTREGRGPGGKGGPGVPGTAVTGDALAKVTAAVKAKDSAVTVTSVHQHPDGTYHVDGTKAGAAVRLHVSKDLTTVTTAPTPPAGGGRGAGGHAHTPVTGDELAKVTAAVEAKDSAVTVTTVRKDADGSYDVDGTKAGAPVRLEVSKDLKTITTREGRGPGGKGAPDAPGAPTPAPSSASTTSTSV